jgi:hypothetical protein
MNEIWKSVIGYEGYYEVSNYGSIRNSKLKILKPSIWGAGYRTIKLSKNNIKETFTLHRLIAIAFIPNPENKPTINHKDGIKLNNNINNLEWVTFSENNKHALCTGLRKSPWIGITGKDNPNSKSIQQFDKHNIFVREYSNAREANKITGINYKHISDCCLNRRKTTGGFIWKFKTNIQE